MTPERAKEIFNKMPQHLKEQVLKIDKAMKKIEEKDKYHFPKKTENKEGGKGKKKVKAKKTKAKKTKAKK